MIKKNNMNKYLRFKNIPKNKKSGIYKNGKIIGYELGVSVFELQEINNSLRLVFPVYIKNGKIKRYEIFIIQKLKMDKETFKLFEFFRSYGDILVSNVPKDFAFAMK